MRGRDHVPLPCGPFDAPLLRYTAMVNGFDTLFITKLVVLDQLAEIPVCVGYRLCGADIDEMYLAEAAERTRAAVAGRMTKATLKAGKAGRARSGRSNGAGERGCADSVVEAPGRFDRSRRRQRPRQRGRSWRRPGDRR